MKNYEFLNSVLADRRLSIELDAIAAEFVVTHGVRLVDHADRRYEERVQSAVYKYAISQRVQKAATKRGDIATIVTCADAIHAAYFHIIALKPIDLSLQHSSVGELLDKIDKLVDHHIAVEVTA
jgi:hypothetical protein